MVASATASFDSWVASTFRLVAPPGALGLYSGGEVHLARTVEALLEHLVTHEVENPDVHGGIAALREREDSGVDADVARRYGSMKTDGWRYGIARLRGVSRRSLVFVDGELAGLVGDSRLVLLDERDLGSDNSLVAIVLDGATDGVGGCY